MVNLLRDKYKPIYTSELECDYPEISEALKNFNFFVISGSTNSGKTTILKLYLSINNYDYLYICENDSKITLEYFIQLFKFKSNSIESFFSQKKYIIVIDNFEVFSTEIKKYIIDNYKKLNNKCVIITNNFKHKDIKIITIVNYSYYYLCNIYENILFLEKCCNTQDIPLFTNITEMFSIIEYIVSSSSSSISSSSSNNNNYEIQIKYDFIDYTINDYFQESDPFKKQYILEKIDNILQFQINLPNNIIDIDDLAQSYNTVCDSICFLSSFNYEYYYQLNLMSTSKSKLKNNEFKIIKKTYDLRMNKKNLNYLYFVNIKNVESFT